MVNKKKESKMTPFEQETLNSIKKILEYKLSSEANIASIYFLKPELLHESTLKISDFSNNIWKVYYAIAQSIVLTEKKHILDEITVGLYLEKHDKLKAKYDEYGGFETITNAIAYVKAENLDGYIAELKKWNTVLKLAKIGFPVSDKLSEYADATAEDIYDELEAQLNHIFINVDSDIKSYNLGDGLTELIEELDRGVAVGLPYHNMPMVTKETGGQYLGSITLVGGLSNVGKTSFARLTLLPSILDNNEKIVIMINEDSVAKWRREFLVYVCNVILKRNVQKHTVRDGKYSEEIMRYLKEAAQWIAERTRDHSITIIPFKSYSTAQAIKVIRKYSSMGVKYFLLDTFKMDSGKVSDNTWMQMAQSMVDIHDVVKAESKNLHIMITFQLAKGSAKQRFYTQENIGVAKNIVDTASTCIMIRNLYEDEYTGGKKELQVYKLEGKNGASKIPVKLERDKHYQVLFIVKNREGSANQYQIVIEVDLSRNLMKEIGITSVPVDW